ncbi:MAG: type II toxin-antitoxin system VapC family toxin [Thermoproteota archaeon]|nr:type II toxin-antitoxin system VapC family toxin [Candidatus Brockarchaeota archaeon]
MVEAESYVDVNVFVYWLGKHPTLGKTAYQWIKKIENSPKDSYLTSTLTLYQTMVIIAGLTGNALKNTDLVKNFIDSITGLQGLKVVPLALRDLIEARVLMEKYELDYEDAVHLAVALRNRVKEIISNDQDFDKTSLKRIFTR